MTKIKNKKYLITYDSNGGNSVATKTVQFLKKFPDVKPTRKGYTFTGWSEKTVDGYLIPVSADWSHVYHDMTVVASTANIK